MISLAGEPPADESEPSALPLADFEVPDAFFVVVVVSLVFPSPLSVCLSY